jgi:antitoxin YefM
MAKVAIDLEADIQPVSDFRAQAATMLQQLRDTRRPIVLTQRGRSAAVLLDIQSYQALLDEIELLRDVHRGLADEAAGRVVSHEDALKRLSERYQE